MSGRDVVVSQLQANLGLFEQFTKDFSDADARFQPCAGGNHVNWVLVHLAVSEDRIVSLVTGQPARLPQTLHDAYGSGRPCRADDPLPRAEEWRVFSEQRQRTLEFVRGFPEARYADPAPPGLPPFCNTLAAVMGLLGSHGYWHFGQISVNRRMLKKPLVFWSP